mmetsp:Transcript_45512/g.120207  ORF Transcript_45512/g.120207 Transcript_45512/m.120207 type:complete len:305 (+) Transcript_45512:52-966(+)
MGVAASRESEAPVPNRPQEVFVLRQGQYYQAPAAPPEPAWPRDLGGTVGLAARPRQHQGPDVTKTVLITNPLNLRKGTLKLIRQEGRVNVFALQCLVDAEIPCEVTVSYLMRELPPAEGSRYPQWEPVLKASGRSQPMRFPLGTSTFTTPDDFLLDLVALGVQEMQYKPNDSPDVYPVVIELRSAEHPPEEEVVQITCAAVEFQGGSWIVKPIVQRLYMPNIEHVYEIREIYGGEAHEQSAASLVATDGPECVVCLSWPRTTTVLPCRHMCLCNHCASVLRLQCNKCPICRVHISSLLQIETEA